MSANAVGDAGAFAVAAALDPPGDGRIGVALTAPLAALRLGCNRVGADAAEALRRLAVPRDPLPWAPRRHRAAMRAVRRCVVVATLAVRRRHGADAARVLVAHAWPCLSLFRSDAPLAVDV